MKITMDRETHQITVLGVGKDASVKMSFPDEKDITGKPDKDGIITFNCKKFIPKHLRKEVKVIVKEEGQNDKEYIYEVRMTKLVYKHVVEVRKEK